MAIRHSHLVSPNGHSGCSQLLTTTNNSLPYIIFFYVESCFDFNKTEPKSRIAGLKGMCIFHCNRVFQISFQTTGSNFCSTSNKWKFLVMMSNGENWGLGGTGEGREL